MDFLNTALNFADVHGPFLTAAFVATFAMLVTWLLSTKSHRLLIAVISDDERLDDKEKERIWQHALHEESDFNDRLNFFLVFESVLLGVIGTLYTKQGINISFLEDFAYLGLGISVSWAYVQARNNYLIDALRKRLEANLHEFNTSVRSRTVWPIRNRWVLTYIIPALVVMMWLVILALFEGVGFP